MMNKLPKTPRPDGADAYLTTGTSSIWCRVIGTDANQWLRIKTWRRRVGTWSKLNRWMPPDRIVKLPVDKQT